eukprot:TRINITY_DN122077_c0_g1_i1.p1 TRINITY_DN122077_c0_g1~~TRINITY_DN122077_c0_g1_i1.p1  ORF type:complete len:607 (+),score=115.67 TRINITY_DN122077_c0_g1_i1:94-1914(+)
MGAASAAACECTPLEAACDADGGALAESQVALQVQEALKKGSVATASTAPSWSDERVNHWWHRHSVGLETIGAAGPEPGEALHDWVYARRPSVSGRCFLPTPLLNEDRPQGVPVGDACRRCGTRNAKVYLDPWDQWKYCKWCWVSDPDNEEGTPPSKWTVWPLVMVEVAHVWQDSDLEDRWKEHPLAGWPPVDPALFSNGTPPADQEMMSVTSSISLKLRTDVVGSHAQSLTQETVQPGETVKNQYKVIEAIGEGSYMEAFLVDDQKTGKQLCLKKHSKFSVEALADLLVLDKRLRKVDPKEVFFPRVHDVFYDSGGYTIESLIRGVDCYTKYNEEPAHFKDHANLKVLARGLFCALARLADAGVVHNDLKPDNIMWLQENAESKTPAGIKVVDFNLARLDQREEPHRNWCRAEGGAGHKGYWPPEMVLGLPITHVRDVWAAGLLVCELFTGRCPYSRHQSDTALVSLAQACGLCGLVEGVPSSLLRRSPLEIQKMFTPAFMPVRGHLPLRRGVRGTVETLRPTSYGLEQVLGKCWEHCSDRRLLHELLALSLTFDPDVRPIAKTLLRRCKYLAPAVAPALVAPAVPREPKAAVVPKAATKTVATS